jgi:predicted  nucleic acid-binding Zn-ribbon protein
VVGRRQNEAERLRTSWRWLQSHHKRLAIQRRSLQDQLAGVDTAIERLKLEIEQAKKRLQKLENA